jgi:hypothetical protein
MPKLIRPEPHVSARETEERSEENRDEGRHVLDAAVGSIDEEPNTDNSTSTCDADNERGRRHARTARQLRTHIPLTADISFFIGRDLV